MKNDDALGAKFAEYNAQRARIDRDTEIKRLQIDNLEKAGFYAKASEVKFLLDRRIAPEHVRLGLWCEENGLKAEALAAISPRLLSSTHIKRQRGSISDISSTMAGG